MTSRYLHSFVSLSILAAFAAASPACSKAEEEEASEDGDVGTACELGTDGSCAEGLICAEGAEGDGFCAIAPGLPCGDGDVENGGCALNAECVAPARTETAADSEAAGGASGEGERVCLLVEGAHCEPDAEHCGNDLTCAEMVSGEHRCFGRVVLRGTVSDTSNNEAIEAAHVIGLDEEGSAVTDISVSEADGSYLLDIPVVRDETGAPTDSTFTLNGSAQDYQPFPSGVRVALPISAGDAQQEGSLYVVESALTDIGLIPLGAGDRVSASGQVTGIGNGTNLAGLLVVASGESGTFTAITDLNGNYTLFNLPDGDYEVRAYGAGAQIGTSSVTIEGENVENIGLLEQDSATATVSGSIQIVNGGGASATSVILVVEDTFNETAIRGEAPRGLRAPESGPVSVDGAFSIEGVPVGRYVVLAAYENDGLVRDPDTSIAGTDIVHIEVSAGDTTVDLDESFKVTGALGIVGPGAESPEAVSGAPTLEWEDDSSEEWYEVIVYDAFGIEIWSDLEVPSVSGSGTVTLEYGGPLEPGMYYQFRVTSWSQSGNSDPAPLSTSEELRGVFYLPAE